VASEDVAISTRFNPTGRSQSLVSGSCDPGWILYGSDCYFNNHEKLNWHDANQACTMMHASLASIRSKGENDFIHYLTGGISTWIGMVDINQNPKSPSDHRWTDNSPVTYRNWNGTDEKADPTSAWYEKSSDQLAPSVCKKSSNQRKSTVISATAARDEVELKETERFPALEKSDVELSTPSHIHEGYVFHLIQSLT
jgi:hypothetical protein